MKTYHSGVHRFAVVVSVCTFLLLIAGALVTSNDAALSVPDWPLSYGTISPPMFGGVVYEHSHRVIAAGVGLLTVILAVLLWMKDERRWVRYLGLAAVGAVIAQGVLGGLTVLLDLHYAMPVAHACLGQIFFGLTVSLALFTSKWWMSDRPQLEDHGGPSLLTIAWINTAVVFLQVGFGAGFRHRDIPIWPHLLGACAVLGTVVWVGAALRKRFDDSREFSRARILLHSVFGVQFLLGMGAWWSRMATADAPRPMPVMVGLTVTHTVVGALVLASSILIVLLCYRLLPRRGAVAVTSGREATI
jgi:heme a synthase